MVMYMSTIQSYLVPKIYGGEHHRIYLLLLLWMAKCCNLRGYLLVFLQHGNLVESEVHHGLQRVS